MSQLPMVAPAEALRINPENLQIANAYLELGNIDKVSEALDIPRDLIAQTLDKREVRSYINQVYFDVGFNNRFNMNQLMTSIIQKKLKDMDEADVGSSKDIIEIIALFHKMNQDFRDHELALEKARGGSTITNQTNVQINGGMSNHDNLIEKILKANGNNR